MTTRSAVMLGVQENSSIRSAPATLIGRPARTETKCRKVLRRNPACTAAANPATAATTIAAATASPTSHRRGETLMRRRYSIHAGTTNASLDMKHGAARGAGKIVNFTNKIS
jgi:hypothetical protein